MKKNCYFHQTTLALSTLILGAAAALCHFAFQFSGKSPIVGAFTPVNESVWEHQKLMYFPLLLWWIVTCLVKNKQREINKNVWITTASISLILSPLLTILLFYGYTGALGQGLVAVDILLVFLVYYIILNIANHLLTYMKPNRYTAIAFTFFAVVLLIAFVVFTFLPPKIPLFHDSVTGSYGI